MATGRIGVTPTLGTRWSKAPSAGTTSLSGLDDSSVSLVYSVGYEQVYRNGVLLSRGNDYTATSGNSITLTDATVNGDIIEVFANELVPLTDAISKGQFTAKGSLLSASAASTPAVLAVGSNNQVLTADSSTSTGLKWATPGSAFVGVSVEHSDFQAISNATWQAVQFDQEVFDTNGFHSTTTNNTRLTVPSGKAGYYRISGFGVFTRNATGLRVLAIYKNGTQERSFPEVTASSATYVGSLGTVTLNLAEGDYIEFFVYQNSGGNLDYRANLGGGYTQAGHEMIYLGA